MKMTLFVNMIGQIQGGDNISNIYNVVECEGEWEDYSEYIRGTFTDKSDADKLVAFLQEKINLKVEQSKRCEACEYGCGDEKIHCDKLKISHHIDGDEYCVNWEYIYDIPHYRIDNIELYNSFDEWMNKYNKNSYNMQWLYIKTNTIY